LSDSLPRPEHPRPQFVRDAWLNLNGEWAFEIDRSDSGLERGLLRRALTGTITVPFAPESIASGVGDVDFLQAVWYRRDLVVPEAWSDRVVLHFGAVDHDTTVWIDGVEVGRHRGGFTSFAFDITDALTPGRAASLTVRARDLKDELQARGKQATWYANTHCNYTRTTGIWQTVWLESVPDVHVKRVTVTPQLASTSFSVRPTLSRNAPGSVFRAVLSDADGVVASDEVRADLDLSPELTLRVPADRVRLWQPSDPHLYDLVYELVDIDGSVVDRVTSYAGLRSVAIDGNRFLLNGEPVFQRLVLDQGYWSETLMTAPSDEALERDILLGLEAGFNGARLHQKVFEERYLFHADRLGYLVWGEYGDWGVSGQGPEGSNQAPTTSFVAEWLEAVARDVNHPAIVGWCPLNETHQIIHDRLTTLDDVTQAMFLATKLADPSRPVIDASGYSHRVRESDVYDSHSYEQDPALFKAEQAGLADGTPWVNSRDGVPFSVPYRGQPFFVSEFGGIWWDAEAAAAAASGADRSESWGYGDRVRDLDEFYARFEGLTGALLDDPPMFGYCYTQLTDVFQEQNGIYDFARRSKFDVERIRAAQLRPAAYEAERTTRASL
jgi:beta-galactosidase/beta-glucuronidase